MESLLIIVVYLVGVIVALVTIAWKDAKSSSKPDMKPHTFYAGFALLSWITLLYILLYSVLPCFEGLYESLFYKFRNTNNRA